MAFSAPSGNIITQSGTNNNLSGLGAVAGVTATTIGTITFYDLGANGLAVTGSLTINADDASNREMLVCGGAGTGIIDVDVRNNGILTVGHKSVQGTNVYVSEQHFPSIFEEVSHDFGESRGKADASGLGTATSRPFLAVQRGGTLNWYGCINCTGGMGFDGSSNTDSNVGGGDCTIDIKDGVWDMRRVTERGAGTFGDQFAYQYSNNFTLDGFTVLCADTATSGGGLVLLNSPLLFKGYKPIFSELAFTGSTSAPNDLILDIRDYAGILGNVGTDMTSATNNINNTSVISFINSIPGSTLVFNTQNPGVSKLRALQEFTAHAANSAGADLENAVIGTWNKDLVITQDAVDGAGKFDLGQILLTEWTPPGGTTPPLAAYNNPSNTADDLWSFYLYSYLWSDRSRIDVLMRGVGGTSADFIVVADEGVTEQIYSNTLALAGISTLDQLYDRAKAYKVNQIAVPSLTETIIEKAGNTLDLGSFDLKLDPDASEAFDIVGSEIIIRADSGSATPGAVPDIVNFTEATTGGATANSITINTPASVVQGDTLLAVIANAQTQVVNVVTPAGWTPIGGELQSGGSLPSMPGINMYVKAVGASEPANHTFTLTGGSTGLIAQIIAVRNNSNALVTTTLATGVSTSPDSNGFAVDTENSRAIVVAFTDNGEQVLNSVPAGYTEVASSNTTAGAGTGE